MLEAPKGHPDSASAAAHPSMLPVARSPQQGAASAEAAAVQPGSAESSSSPVQSQPNGSTVSPLITSGSRTGVRPPPVPALRLAAQQGTPPPAVSAASAQAPDSGALHAAYASEPVGPPQPALPGTVMGEGAVRQSPDSVAMVGSSQPFPPSTASGCGSEQQAVAPSGSLQNSPIRDPNMFPGLPQSSAWGGPPVSVHPSSLPRPAGKATSSAEASPALHGDLAGKGLAAQGALDLTAHEQLTPDVSHSAKVPEEVSSKPLPAAGFALQQSPPLGFLSTGCTPVLQTIKGMCSLGMPMPAQLSPAPSSSMPGVLLGALQRDDSSVAGTVGSPAMVGSLGVGSTPAGYTIRALESAGETPEAREQEPALPQGKLWQVASVHAPMRVSRFQPW